MHLRKIVSLSTLGTFIAALAIGCQGSDVEGVKVETKDVPPPGNPVPLSKDEKKGGGPGSSGNMKRNPGGDPLKQ